MKLSRLIVIFLALLLIYVSLSHSPKEENKLNIMDYISADIGHGHNNLAEDGHGHYLNINITNPVEYPIQCGISLSENPEDPKFTYIGVIAPGDVKSDQILLEFENGTTSKLSVKPFCRKHTPKPI